MTSEKFAIVCVCDMTLERVQQIWEQGRRSGNDWCAGYEQCDGKNEEKKPGTKKRGKMRDMQVGERNMRLRWKEYPM